MSPGARRGEGRKAKVVLERQCSNVHLVVRRVGQILGAREPVRSGRHGGGVELGRERWIGELSAGLSRRADWLVECSWRGRRIRKAIRGRELVVIRKLGVECLVGLPQRRDASSTVLVSVDARARVLDGRAEEGAGLR